MRFFNLFGFVKIFQKTRQIRISGVFFKTGKYIINLRINQFYFPHTQKRLALKAQSFPGAFDLF